MKIYIHYVFKHWIGGLAVAFLGLLLAGHAQAQIYISSSNGTVGEYNRDGSTVNDSLVTGVSNLGGIAVTGGDLFVASINGPVAEYDGSGNLLNSSVVSTYTQYPLNGGIAAQGTTLYVTDRMGPSYSGTNPAMFGTYSTSGTTLKSMPTMKPGVFDQIAVSGTYVFVTTSLGAVLEFSQSAPNKSASLVINTALSSLTTAIDIAVSGNEVFVANSDGTVGEYDASGNTISSSLISHVSGLNGITVFGTDLFLTSSDGTVSEYDTTGNQINATLITGVSGLNDIVVVEAVPEPSTWACVAVGGLGLMGMLRRDRRKA